MVFRIIEGLVAGVQLRGRGSHFEQRERGDAQLNRNLEPAVGAYKRALHSFASARAYCSKQLGAVR